MRLPPGTDPTIRNELVKADRQLKLLSSALAKALTKTNLPTAVIGVGPPGGSPPGQGLPDHDHRGSGFGGDVLGRTGFQMNAKGTWNFDDSIQASTAKVRIAVDSATQVGLEIQAASAQSANLLRVMTSAGSGIFGVSKDGFIGVGTYPNDDRAVYAALSKTNSGAQHTNHYLETAIVEDSGSESSQVHNGIFNNFQMAGSGDFSFALAPHNAVDSTFQYSGTDGTAFPDFNGVRSTVIRGSGGSIGIAAMFDASFTRGTATGGSTISAYGYRYSNAAATGTLTNQRGFYSAQLSGATNNHDFYGEGPQSYFKKIGVNITATGIGQCHIVNATANSVGLALKMATSQSSNIFELRDSANTLLNLIDNTGCLMTLTNGAGSPLLSDSTTVTKRLGVSLSGGVGNNLLSVVNTLARTYTLGDDTGTLVSRTASVDLAGQTATIGSTTMYTSPHAGIYRVSVYAKTTTAGSGGDTVTVTIGWNDGTAQTYTTATLNLAVLNSYLQDSVVLYSNSAAITYATTVAAAGAPQYTLRLRVEAL